MIRQPPPRPKRPALLLLLFLLLNGCGPTRVVPVRPGSSPTPTAPHLELEDVPDRLVEEHNRYRADAGLSHLAKNDQLQAAAQAHADQMARSGRMSHRGSGGSSVRDRVILAGYDDSAVGENVAKGQTSVDEVMRDWVKSPGHRGNILGKYSQIGAACAIGEDGRTYWCVTFGRPTAH